MTNLSDILPWIGYAASIIIAISMTMSSIVRFRWINIIGAITFSVYGFLLGAIPVGILNGLIVLVDIYYLQKIYSKKEIFDTLEINSENDYLVKFLKYHNERIQKICPGFAYDPDMNTVSFFILRNASVAGLFLAHRDAENDLIVGLDYVLPEYKDFKNGKYVYFNLKESFKKMGYTRVKAKANDLPYVKYLKKLGFNEEADGFYSKEL